MYRIRKIIFSVALMGFGAVLSAETPLTVVASGDAHGMVQACDCNIEPGGGLPKRASLINTLGGRNSILLLDAGGFSAGGLYDSYTEGRKADSIKTEQILIGMGVLRYDAVGVGDDDLQYGGEWLLQRAKASGVPLVSANCFRKNNGTYFTPYLIIKKGTKKIAVTSVVTNEKLFSTDLDVIIQDPLKSLRKIWKEMAAKSDYQVVLSHLGSTKTVELVDSLPGCDLAVNGHRKSETNALTYAGNVPVLQFGFQGKALSYATVGFQKDGLSVEKNGWHIIADDLPDDKTVQSAISTLQSGKQTYVYDLYIMSQCPYGLEALTGFVRFIEKNPSVNWNIWFIGSVENDTVLNSLHGQAEVKDEMLWLAVKELYPSRWFEFVKNRADTSVPTEVILKKMGIAQADLEKWADLNGAGQLSGHYLRSDRVNIKASPTLLVNNVPFEKQISAERLMKNLCESGEKSSFCDSLPQCIDESDCKQKGKIGRCVDRKCVYIDAAPFQFTVLVADSVHQHPENTVIATTEDLFAGATVETVKLSSKRGAEIVKMYSPEALPFYLFNKDVRQAYNFDQVGSGLIEKNDGLFFKKGIVRNNYYYKREKIDGQIVLYIDPFFKDIPGILTALQKDPAIQKKISIVPVFYKDPQNDLWGTEEGFRQEEALRWLVMDTFFKNKLNAYLLEYSKSPGSSYWVSMLDKAGVETDTFVTTLSANSDMLLTHWKQILGLSIHEPVVVLFDNREIAVAGNKQELESLLKIK